MKLARNEFHFSMKQMLQEALLTVASQRLIGDQGICERLHAYAATWNRLAGGSKQFV